MSETTYNPDEVTDEAREEHARRVRARLERMQKHAEHSARLQMKAGDECYVYHFHSSRYYTKHTVTRVTDASIFIGGTAYKRGEGRARSRYASEAIYPALPHIVAAYAAQEQAKTDKADAERRRDYLREGERELKGRGVTYTVGPYALLEWESGAGSGEWRYALYGKNAEGAYKRVRDGFWFTSLAEALAALAGAIATTDAERLALIRLIAGRE